jgi:hypothetical protein
MRQPTVQWPRGVAATSLDAIVYGEHASQVYK